MEQSRISIGISSGCDRKDGRRHKDTFWTYENYVHTDTRAHSANCSYGRVTKLRESWSGLFVDGASVVYIAHRALYAGAAEDRR